LYLDPLLINLRKWRMQRPHIVVTRAAPERLVFLFPWDFVSVAHRQERIYGDEADDARNAAVQLPDAQPDSTPDSPAAKRKRPFQSIAKRARTARKADTASRLSGPPDGIEAGRPITVNSWLPPDEIYSRLRALQPASLIGFASTLANLARWMLASRASLSSVKNIWTTSEVLSPEGADVIRNAFCCEPLTIYASNEFGFMGWQKATGGPILLESDRLHFNYLPLPGAHPDGHASRCLIVTDLLNDTTPLIRYNIGDVATPIDRVVLPLRDTAHGGVQRRNEKIELDALTNLEGKETDIVTSTSGEVVSAFRVLATIRDTLPTVQYRFVAIGGCEYVLQYRPSQSIGQDDVDRVRICLQEILGEDALIHLQQVTEINREASGKIRPLINLSNIQPVRRISFTQDLGLDQIVQTDIRFIAKTFICDQLSAISGAPFSSTTEEDAELYRDLGIDSLRFLHLLLAIEKHAQVRIDDEDLLEAELVTFGDLIDFVCAMITRQGKQMSAAPRRTA
ncbi:MAG: acyl carrier protein, partial [Bryobacteraceae bacterium]